MPKRRAIVIGGSLGGLLAANMLHSIGWHVDVFERTGDDLASRGAGIGTHDELFEILARIGIVVDDSLGVVPLSRTCLDRSGKPVASIQRPRVLSSWGRIYRTIKDAFPESRYHFGKHLSHYEERSDKVVARFADGSTAEADLLIGADGLRSTVRQQLFPETKPRYAGYVAWRGMVPEALLPEALHKEFFDHQILCMPEGQNIVAYPVPGPNNDIRPGHRAYNFVWYSPVDEASGLRDLSTDAGGRYYENGIPPDMIRPELIAEMRALAKKLLAPQFGQVLDRTPQIFFQAIYDLESPKMGQGRVALLGDAAFVARPHCALGVTKAALDAESLADALDTSGGDIAAAVARYDEEQGEFGRRTVARGRKLGAHIEAQHKPRELRTPEELSRDPEKWIRESGCRLSDIPDLIEIVRTRKKRRESEKSERGAETLRGARAR
jgi:2-polyprenyl-6-methoxyphenol hydroxylase-like FAD-dependent oxidoreductase